MLAAALLDLEGPKEGKLLDVLAARRPPLAAPLPAGSCFLRQIDLSRNKLTDRGCASALAALLRAPAAGAVEDLSLEENFISEVGLAAALQAAADGMGQLAGTDS